jgi:RNA polymerase sigma-70 factor, ECF subfamily
LNGLAFDDDMYSRRPVRPGSPIGATVQRELVEAARLGDHEAFEALAASAGTRLLTIARLVLRDGPQAEDAVQDALVRAWQSLPHLRDPDRWDAWLHRLVVRACADQGRRRRRHEAEVSMIGIEAAVGDQAGSIVVRDQLDRGFRRLKPDQRTALVLRFYVGLSVPEVADALGVPVGTAKSKIHYAVEAMRAELQADERASTVTAPEVAR